ncbi:MAG TPA: LysE family translocator [Solirubrobacteraceae bacterium]|nr:LysE family translocator [Solirubrobacteraceae bacterium]
MRPSLVATFTTIDVLLVLTPGPDWAYVVAVGLRDQVVLPAVAGLVAGYAALTVLVAAGLAALITASPGALTAVTLIGGAYLIWLGASVLSRPTEADDGDGPENEDEPLFALPGANSTIQIATRGAATSGLNPKGLLLFVAVLPQFVDRHGGVPVAAQIGVLGAIHMANCAVAYLGVGSLARNLLTRRPTAAHTVTRLAGAAMIVLGALLLLERAVR